MRLLADFGIAGQVLEDVAKPALGSGGSALAQIGKSVAPVADDIGAALVNKKKKFVQPLQQQPPLQNNPQPTSNVLQRPSSSTPNQGVVLQQPSLTNNNA